MMIYYVNREFLRLFFNGDYLQLMIVIKKVIGSVVMIIRRIFRVIIVVKNSVIYIFDF